MRAIRYTAAGGVVVDGNLVLVLHRPSRSEVRLPKGQMKKGEASWDAALREVTEESGYADLAIVADLGHQVVEYDYQEAHIVRDEQYYLMRLDGPRRVARSEDDLQYIPGWLTWDEALEALTFEAEREWVRRARR